MWRVPIDDKPRGSRPSVHRMCRVAFDIPCFPGESLRFFTFDTFLNKRKPNFDLLKSLNKRKLKIEILLLPLLTFSDF